MFVALVLIVMAGVIWSLRNRLASVEQRLALIEGGTPRSTDTISKLVTVPVVQPEERPAEPQISLPETHSALHDYRAARAEPVDAQSLPEEEIGRSTVSGQLENEPEDLEPAPAPPTPNISHFPSISFEDLFGRRLPIWAGGATLAVAGVLLVKYSIDAGLLSPWIRIVLGIIFGTALIGGAEVALRQEERLRDPRVRQALAGAGLATLYASVLAAHNLYDLVGPAMAFIGLAATTALAMGLSVRFGAPSALLGLIGGLAAPALVSTGQPNVPLLACYLALAIGGLCTLSRTQRWMWLGVGALVGGAGWGTLMLAMGALDAAASISVALLLIALGVAFPLFAFSGARAAGIRMIAGLVAAAQMAALVATGGFTLLHWGLFGLLAVALTWMTGRTPALRPIGAVGLVIALMLAGAWPSPMLWPFIGVMTGVVAIHAGPSLVRLWRAGGGLIEAGQVAGVALGGIAVALIHFHRADRDLPFALLALLAAALPALGAALGWNKAARRDDTRLALLATASALLLALSGGLAMPGWSLTLVVAAVATGLLHLSGRAEDRYVEWSSWTFAITAFLLLIAELGQIEHLFGEGISGTSLQPALRWSGLALATAMFAWRARLANGRIAAQSIAMLLGYGAAAQVVPAMWLPIVPAFALPALAEAGRRMQSVSLRPALGMALALSLGWALWPIGHWAMNAMVSLAGQPLLVSALPPVIDAMTRLALPAAMILWVALFRAPAKTEARIWAGIAATLGFVSLHILYKQFFHLSTMNDVIHFALAERTLWQALLLATAYALWRFAKSPRIALGVTGTALGHALFYTLTLHDPLWWPQHVGALPVANLLIPAFAVPFAALQLGHRIAPDWCDRLKRPADMMRMIAILLFAYAALRQMFAGSLLTAMPVGAGEDILRSVLAATLAIGFLLWGMRSGSRDWRIASLLLMLAAVAKVFLFDASGLDGLLRIASFLALGFSLIGIGWLYNRLLRDMPD